MLFPFLKTKDKTKSFAVFCIDSAGVTLSVISKNTENKEHISHISRLSLEIGVSKDTNRIIRNVSNTIDKIFAGFKKHRLFDVIKPDTEIVVLVGSPWHIGWNEKIKVEKEKHFKVTEKLIDESILNSFGELHKDLEITDKVVMGTKLNGYVMKDPHHKLTRSLELSVYLSASPKVFTEAVRNNIKARFPHNNISFHAYNIALYNAILYTTGKSDCMVVIPEIETTEIILIKNGIIESEASVPFGGATLAQSLFGAKSSGIKESLLKTKRFVEGTLDVSDLDKIGDKMKKVKEDFLNQFRDVVWKMGDTLVLPSDFFVIGRNLATHFVFEWLNSDEYIRNTFTVEDFKIVNLRGGDIISQKEFNGLFHHKSVPLSVAVSTQFVVKK